MEVWRSGLGVRRLLLEIRPLEMQDGERKFGSSIYGGVSFRN